MLTSDRVKTYGIERHVGYSRQYDEPKRDEYCGIIDDLIHLGIVSMRAAADASNIHRLIPFCGLTRWTGYLASPGARSSAWANTGAFSAPATKRMTSAAELSTGKVIVMRSALNFSTQLDTTQRVVSSKAELF